jgi:predicted ATP-dependent protease
MEEPRAQDALADLLTIFLQRGAASSIQHWLTEAPPDAHLYVTGAEARGRTSLVSTLARRAMATQPAPPDYCYVPDPDAPQHFMVLALPPGTAVPFADLVQAALMQLARDWSDLRPPAETSSVGPDQERSDAPTEPPVSPLHRYFAPALATAPSLGRAYLERLSAALERFLGAPWPPNLVGPDAPAGRITRPLSVEQGAVFSAPVVILAHGHNFDRALARANGGILVIPGDELLDRDQPSSTWATLRVALRSGQLFAQGTREPAIPLQLRTIIVGDEGTFSVLCRKADDFTRYVRYLAPFEHSVEWVEQGESAYQAEAAYAALVAGATRAHGLPEFAPGAVARVIEAGARELGGLNHTRLSTDLTVAHDLVIETGRRVAADGVEKVSGEDVQATIASRRARLASRARGARRAILAEYEHIPTAGESIGQVNGLGVSLLFPSERAFGVPLRVTATVSPGRERFIDIAHEANAAGHVHTLGSLTLAGYLAARYGQSRALSAVIRMRFEQEHTITDGDSASAATLYAILSALAEAPITSSRALTGAVGQYGEIQTIGGVNEKIEGFWEICQARRERGERPDVPYGMLIPAANAQDLMLRPEVIAAIAEDGWFHLWPIRTLDDGIPLLFGLPAADLHARVDARLQRFFELAAPQTPTSRG